MRRRDGSWRKPSVEPTITSPARGEFLAHLRDGERLVVRDLETGGGAACYENGRLKTKGTYNGEF
jgi:hypothetical protein